MSFCVYLYPETGLPIKMKTIYIPDWKTWELLAEHHDFDPYKEVEFSVDKGGGSSDNFEYIGDIPKDE